MPFVDGAPTDPETDPGLDHGMDPVFRALADPSRRRLLDGLRERDGQTLTELCEALPDMTRFGVMKHLAVLEEAHLVVTERHGRSKHHYLNPVPIRRIHDRWISKYAEPFASALIELTELRDPA
jgi:DNA-binding transcriptional ArsR family regulator